jgi:hypothetical protein
MKFCNSCHCVLTTKRGALPGKGVCLNDRCEKYGTPQFGYYKRGA